jgi:hypothetical protein
MFSHGRRALIPDDIKALMFAYVTHEFRRGRPVRYDAILDWLYAEHHLSIIPDTLRHVIRRPSEFETIVGIPMEENRCHVTVEAIENHFANLSREIENVPAAFIFNADESGFQEFVDSLGKWKSLFLQITSVIQSHCRRADQRNAQRCSRLSVQMGPIFSR